jgi:signal transduction histidine kinase
MLHLNPGWSDLSGDLVVKRAARPSVLQRFTVPERTAAFWIALAVLVVATELGALYPVLSGSQPAVASDLVYRLVGGSFAACGLIAWHRRPDSHGGVLMLVTGVAFLLTPLLIQVDAPLAATVAMFISDIWIFAFLPLVLTNLSGGRLQSRVDWLLIAAFALPLLVLQLVWMLLLEQEDNVIGFFPDAGAADAVDKAQRSLCAVAGVATAAVLAIRWKSASRPLRRALLPSIAGAFALLMFTSLLVNDLITGERSETLLWIALASLITVPAAFLFGLLRSRLARHGLAELLLGMRTLRGEQLQRALSRAIGDQSLKVAYGPAAVVPAPGRATAPVERDGRVIATLVYDAALDDDPELVEAVGAAAAIALENEHLHAESDARMEELRASRERLVAAGDEERRRLERNLHDGAQQRLVALSLQLRMIQGRIRGDPGEAEDLVDAASDELAQSLSELRELARGIHPAVLNHGLPAALEALADRSPVPTLVECESPDRLPETVELAAYFVASEALANVAKYSRAAHASVRLTRTDGVAVIQIADDGVGGADERAGSGLRGLGDRVEALSGRLYVTSPAGAGTVVTAELPVV